MQKFLREDDISFEDLDDYSNFPVLENKSPKLCTDRLDGVLHTCYIWLHTHSLEQIKEVYDDMTILNNEEGCIEIGFNNIKIAEKFAFMVYNYAKELQGNTDKFVMKYISEIVKLSVAKNLISLEDLYVKKEEDICSIFHQNFLSWKKFNETSNLIRTNQKPNNRFYISFETKKRNALPLVHFGDSNKRITEVSTVAQSIYYQLEQYHDSTYAYIEEIKNLNVS